MAARRGNSASYHSARTNCSKINDPTLEGRPTLSALEKVWWWSVSHDPLRVAHDRGKAASFANESINGGDVADALDFLADMTGDHAFLTAALALRGYGLAGGGLKQDTLRLVREQKGTAAWAAMPRMHSWKQVKKSERAAAARTAVQLGIPGSSFKAVIEELRKTYPALNGVLMRDLALHFITNAKRKASGHAWPMWAAGRSSLNRRPNISSASN